MSNSKEYIPSSWEHVNCLFCNSDQSIIHEKFGSKMQYTYLECKKCSLIYSSPRPTYNKEFIDRAYASYYQFAGDLKLDEFTKVNESSIPMFKAELENITKFDKNKTATLDIGSGMGTYLYAAKSIYPICIGLDVSEKMGNFIEQNLGIKVFNDQFEDFDYPTKFSLIHMSHVIEHIPNPNEWIQKAKEMLATDGILVVNVPHKHSISNKLQYLFYKLGLKKRVSSGWSDAERTPDHLFEPTINSMKYLFEKNEFKVLDFFTYSRRDPASNKSFFTKLMNRKLHWGTNLSFIVTPKIVV